MSAKQKKPKPRKEAPAPHRDLQCPLCGAWLTSRRLTSDEARWAANCLKPRRWIGDHHCPARTFHGHRHQLTEAQIAFALSRQP